MYIRIQSSLKPAHCLHSLPLQLELENFKWKVQFIYINNFRLSFIFWHPAGHRSWIYTLLMPPRKSSISSRRKETKQNCLFSPCAKRSQRALSLAARALTSHRKYLLSLSCDLLETKNKVLLHTHTTHTCPASAQQLSLVCDSSWQVSFYFSIKRPH